ncbi:hypothetical protein HNQ50_000197 [Silvimonas terrae]|uniref:Uncharacterized protein n=1 Tax=Silvimonas terrae TaxID=300266 RepID=A0A840R9B3_9NEIS|nr:hypothetical protein [Silvimonas terrae]MBB5189487.1 hypothetical protein [Silvimonas terrae]
MQQHRGYLIETSAELDVETLEWYPTLTIGLATEGVDPQLVFPWQRVSRPSQYFSEAAANAEALRVARFIIESGRLPPPRQGAGRTA